MNYLRLGDVLNINGAPHIVDMVNDCRARCIPITRKAVKIASRFNEAQVATFTVLAASVSISPRYEDDADNTVEHWGRKGLEEFLAGRKTGAGRNKQTSVTNADQPENIMANKNKVSSTPPAAKKAKTEEAPKLGKLGGIFDCSTTSVLRRMGKEGITTEHARDIMKAMKVKASDTTVSIQVNNGRNGKGGDVAAITQAQVKELKSAAPDPAIARAEQEKADEAAAKAAKAEKAAAKAAAKEETKAAA